MEGIIKVSNLKKQYGQNVVLKDISFTVYKGEIFAYLGTNGAGKTTTLECIEGIRKYNNGNIEINGKIGVQLQSSSLPEGIKGYEALKLFAMWNKTEPDMEFVNKISMNNILKKTYKSMSTGEKRKLHLALALTGNPDIVFLDEPTAGLDVESRVIIHDEIRHLKENGKTIIMASHDMAEVENLCDRLAILKDGQIAFCGTVSDLTKKMQKTYKIHLKLANTFDNSILKHCTYKDLDKGYSIYETANIEDGLLELMSTLKEKNIKILDIKIENTSLEDSFINIAKGEI